MPAFIEKVYLTTFLTTCTMTHVCKISLYIFVHFLNIITNVLNSYAMDGLSADKLRVLLHPTKDTKKETNDNKKVDEDNANFEIQETKESMEQAFRDNMVLATLQDGTRGKWKTAQVMYSFALPHKVPFIRFTLFKDKFTLLRLQWSLNFFYKTPPK